MTADWRGHSTLVAQKHYWQVTDSDSERASGAENAAAILSKATQVAEFDALVVEAKTKAIFTAMATDPEVAEIAAMWANLSPTARQCMMLLIRNS